MRPSCGICRTSLPFRIFPGRPPPIQAPPPVQADSYNEPSDISEDDDALIDRLDLLEPDDALIARLERLEAMV